MVKCVRRFTERKLVKIFKLTTAIDTDARELLQNLKSKGVPKLLASTRIFDRSITPDELYMYTPSQKEKRKNSCIAGKLQLII
jgi:hypothetical protein